MKPDLCEKQVPNAELTTKSVVLQLGRPNTINQESGTDEKHRVDHNQQLTRTLIDHRCPLFWVRTIHGGIGVQKLVELMSSIHF